MLNPNTQLILNLLHTMPLFATLSQTQHEQIIEHITLEYYPADHLLFEEGSRGDTLYLIKSGTVQISAQGKALAQLKEGDFFGEMALLGDEPHMASAKTLSECELFSLKKQDFDSLLEKSPDIAEAIRDTSALRKEEDRNLS